MCEVACMVSALLHKTNEQINQLELEMDRTDFSVDTLGAEAKHWVETKLVRS